MPNIALGACIHYETFGPEPGAPQGLPVLLLAPGGLRSRIGLWRHTHDGRPRPWPDPTVALACAHRVVALDQRNAGLSRAPVTPGDGWHSFAADHLGVLDALGIDRFHVVGACIGSSFALKLAELAPQRVASAVLQQPIGWTAENALLRPESFEAWALEARPWLPGVPEAHLRALERNLFGSDDFVFSVSREFVRETQKPLLILAGNDVHHPAATSRELAALARHARLVLEWTGEANRAAYVQGILAFFREAEAAA